MLQRHSRFYYPVLITSPVSQLLFSETLVFDQSAGEAKSGYIGLQEEQLLHQYYAQA